MAALVQWGIDHRYQPRPRIGSKSGCPRFEPTRGYTPPLRKRAQHALTLAEREEISRGLSAGHSLRQIAKALQRASSAISREVVCNGGRRGYRATEADKAAWARARRPKVCRLAQHGKLRQTVANKLAQDWSPEQISGWLKCQYPNDVVLRVSHETIYKSIFVQTRGVLKKELQKHLRTQRAFRQSRSSRLRGSGRGQIVDGVSIAERPRRLKTVRFLGTGKVISWRVLPTRTLRHCRPPLYVTSRQLLDELLPQLQQRHDHMAVVIDEYGTAVGMIILEDVLEEVVGEVVNIGYTFEGHLPRQRYNIAETEEAVYEMDGRVPVGEVNDTLDVILPALDAHNAGGMVIAHLRHIPKAGEYLDLEGCRLTVLETGDLGIRTLRAERTGYARC